MIEKKMNEKQDGAIETSDEKTSESKKPHFTVPYAPSVKYIIEKYGLGDEEDFKKRINAINRFYDNEEIRTNIQVLGNKAKGESLGKTKTWDIFHDPKKSKDFSQRRYKNCPSVMGDTWRRDAEVVKSGRGSSLAARNNCFGTSYHGWEDFSRGSSIFSKILCLLCSFCLNSDEYHMTDPNDSITCVRYTVPSF